MMEQLEVRHASPSPSSGRWTLGRGMSRRVAQKISEKQERQSLGRLMYYIS